MVFKKPGRDLINSSICRQTHWYENQSWSDFFDNSMPKVLLQNDVNSGFNGGSCSKKAYNFSSVDRLLTSRSMRTGTSLVRISHAIFEYLKRTFSGRSGGGSVVINATNSSIISGRCKLMFSFQRKREREKREEKMGSVRIIIIQIDSNTCTLTIVLDFYSDLCSPAKCPHLLEALGALHPMEIATWIFVKNDIILCGLFFYIYLFVK